jgi:hypothetical protein
MTAAGVAHIVAARNLFAPSAVFEVRPNLALENYTSLELLDALVANGWEWQSWHRRRGRPDPYKNGGPKVHLVACMWGVRKAL